jgi:hypothetical protein
LSGDAFDLSIFFTPSFTLALLANAARGVAAANRRGDTLTSNDADVELSVILFSMSLFFS